MSTLGGATALLVADTHGRDAAGFVSTPWVAALLVGVVVALALWSASDRRR